MLAALAPRLAELGHPARRWRRRGPSGTRARSRRWPRWPPAWPSWCSARRWRRRGPSRTRGPGPSAGRAGPAPGGAGPPGRGAGGGAGHRGRGVPVRGAGRAGPPPGGAGPPGRGAGGGAGHRGRGGPVPALAALAPHLTEPLLREALEAARAIGDEGPVLARRWPPPGGARPPGRGAGGGAGHRGRVVPVRGVAALAPHLTEPWLREALEAARAIGDEGSRSAGAGRAGPPPGGARPPGRGAGGGAGHRGRGVPVPRRWPRWPPT